MKLGVETFFRQLNDQGGVVGRKVNLVALDDEYEPAKALPNMKDLFENRKVFAVIGNVGTPTAKETAPYALEHRLLFFAPYTGAKLLRNDPPDRYVFNFRASYAEETAATVHYLVKTRKIQPEQIAVFAQNDSYGDSGFDGVCKALAKIAGDRGQDFDKAKVLRVGYARNTVDVEAAVQEVLKHRDQIKAVVMVPAYKPAAKFIQRLKDEKMDVTFTSVSFVGSEALAEELKALGPSYYEGVIVTQVVPHHESGATAVIKYRDALKKYFPDEKSGFISLEGYLAASLLAEGMPRCGDDLTTDRLIEQLESIHDLDIGVGAPVNFRQSEHQASHKVWGAVLDKTAHYQILDME
jgi:ABC-type branched-subunit amino acid transport system substrate-binding protein